MRITEEIIQEFIQDLTEINWPKLDQYVQKNYGGKIEKRPVLSLQVPLMIS